MPSVDRVASVLNNGLLVGGFNSQKNLTSVGKAQIEFLEGSMSGHQVEWETLLNKHLTQQGKNRLTRSIGVEMLLYPSAVFVNAPRPGAFTYEDYDAFPEAHVRRSLSTAIDAPNEVIMNRFDKSFRSTSFKRRRLRSHVMQYSAAATCTVPHNTSLFVRVREDAVPLFSRNVWTARLMSKIDTYPELVLSQNCASFMGVNDKILVAKGREGIRAITTDLLASHLRAVDVPLWVANPESFTEWTIRNRSRVVLIFADLGVVTSYRSGSTVAPKGVHACELSWIRLRNGGKTRFELVF